LFREAFDKIGQFLTGGPSHVGLERRHAPRLAGQWAAIARNGNDQFPVSIVNVGPSGLGLEASRRSASGNIISISPAPAHHAGANESEVEIEVKWCYVREHDGRVIIGTRFVAGNHLEESWLGPLLREASLNWGDQEQKRKHVRLNSVLKAELRELETGRYLNEGDVSNISLGGILVKTTKSMHAVPPLLVLIGPYSNYPTLFLPARLVNSRQDDDGRVFLHALEFLNTSPEQKETLESLIKGIMEES